MTIIQHSESEHQQTLSSARTFQSATNGGLLNFNARLHREKTEARLVDWKGF
jgi:hypothetical protein